MRRAGHEPVLPERGGGDHRDVDAAVIEPGDSRGLPLARRLRALGRPVLFASIFPAEQETLDLEPAAYFVKPFALAELEVALGAALLQHAVLSRPHPFGGQARAGADDAGSSMIDCGQTIAGLGC